MVEPDGNTTTWSAVEDIFADKADGADAAASDAKFVSSGNKLVTAKDGGADKSEFVGWTLADCKRTTYLIFKFKYSRIYLLTCT
jgi:hypothetical protein